MALTQEVIAVSVKLLWSPDAEAALERVPRAVRGLARGRIEREVSGQGRDTVVLADYERLYDQFRRMVGVGRSGSGNVDAASMPAMKDEAPAMVTLDICHAELRNCPHMILNPAEWESAFREVIGRGDYDNRLRAKVQGVVVLFHHKFRIAISGCPNGCSQPQIKDFGVLGMNRVLTDAGLCIHCRLCEEACPDAVIHVDEAGPQIDANNCLSCRDCSVACPTQSISVMAPAGRIVIGGKVGRHPQWARMIAEFADLNKACELLEFWLERYVNEGLPDERFAVFLNRVLGDE